MRLRVHQGQSGQDGRANLHRHRRTNRHGPSRLRPRQSPTDAVHAEAPTELTRDCGRNKAILNSTVLQSDQQDLLITVLKATARALGGNTQVRQKPAYSSQSQGSVERYHATLAAQIQTLRGQIEENYNTVIGARHPITPWIVRHAAYLLNKDAAHSESQTSDSGDGTRNAKHHSASLEKQCSA